MTQDSRPAKPTEGSEPSVGFTELLEAGAKVLAAHDEVVAYLKVGMPSRALLREPDRKGAERAFAELRAAISKALGPSVGGEGGISSGARAPVAASSGVKSDSDGGH